MIYELQLLVLSLNLLKNKGEKVLKKLSTIAIALIMVTCIFFSVAAKNDNIKIGFLVHAPEEDWFQDEWRFADQAARELGFELIKIGATDGEKALTAIDNLAAQQAQGFIINTPDVKLGPAIKAKADMYGMKFMSVDLRFLDSNGNDMEEIHHMGISAYDIGRLVGRSLVEEMEDRNWKNTQIGYLKMTFDELPTIAERTDGATDVLLENGFPKENIYESPMRTLDTEGSFNAAHNSITKHPNVNKWIIAGGNDPAVIGAIRALEGQGFTADQVIGIGINGSSFAISEFEKDEPNGFFASVKLSARKHGYDISKLMYKWITEGEEPPLVIWTSGELMTRENYKELME